MYNRPILLLHSERVQNEAPPAAVRGNTARDAGGGRSFGAYRISLPAADLSLHVGRVTVRPTPAIFRYFTRPYAEPRRSCDRDSATGTSRSARQWCSGRAGEMTENLAPQPEQRRW
jgi:hypothetical protein